MPNVLQKPNAEHALLLVQNMSCDKHCRKIINKADGMALLLELLRQYAGKHTSDSFTLDLTCSDEM